MLEELDKVIQTQQQQDVQLAFGAYYFHKNFNVYDLVLLWCRVAVF